MAKNLGGKIFTKPNFGTKMGVKQCTCPSAKIANSVFISFIGMMVCKVLLMMP
jgi:hypothetical protein